jgi:putative restriction endonuclease
MDAAFDAGLITFDSSLRLVLSKQLRRFLPNDAVKKEFVDYEGTLLSPPEKYRPKSEYLDYHREHIFHG